MRHHTLLIGACIRSRWGKACIPILFYMSYIKQYVPVSALRVVESSAGVVTDALFFGE